MSGPNPNRQPVELNRTSLYWGSSSNFVLAVYSQVISLINIKSRRNLMAGTGRVPLWLVALVGGLAVIGLLSSLFMVRILV